MAQQFGHESLAILSARHKPANNMEMPPPLGLSIFEAGRRRSVAFAGCLALIAGTASGCASFPSSNEPPCGPPGFSVNPSSAKAGDKVTVTAPNADCNPRYGTDARIQVTVTDATSVQVISSTAPMNDAGGFSYSFDVPAQTAVGNATVTAMPYNIDWCDDTGKNNRAGGATRLLQRASCATPMASLGITP